MVSQRKKSIGFLTRPLHLANTLLSISYAIDLSKSAFLQAFRSNIAYWNYDLSISARAFSLAWNQTPLALKS
jgi:hypothetical protein